MSERSGKFKSANLVPYQEMRKKAEARLPEAARTRYDATYNQSFISCLWMIGPKPYRTLKRTISV